MTSDDFPSPRARRAISHNSSTFFAHSCDAPTCRCIAEVSTFIMWLPTPSATIVATISIADTPVLHNSLHCDLRPGYEHHAVLPFIIFRLIRMTMLLVMLCKSSLMTSAPLPRRSRPSDLVPTLRGAAQASCRRRAEQHTRPAAGAVHRQPEAAVHTQPGEAAHTPPEAAEHRLQVQRQPPASAR